MGASDDYGRYVVSHRNTSSTVKICVSSSDIEDDSQASQLLQDLLGSEIHQTSKPCDARREDLTSKDASADPLPPSRNSNSVPQYHFHGLASTQTETQSYEDDGSHGVERDSRKGDVETARSKGEPRSVIASSPVATSLIPPPQDSPSGNTLTIAPHLKQVSHSLSRTKQVRAVKGYSLRMDPHSPNL